MNSTDTVITHHDALQNSLACKADGDSPEFHQLALNSYSQGQAITEVLEVTNVSAWLMLMVLASIALCALIISIVGYVDVTTRGRGALRSTSGATTLNAEISGRVKKVLVHSGDLVNRGQPLLEIHSPEIDAQVLEAQKRFKFVESQVKQSQHRLKALYKVRIEQLEQKMELLMESKASQEKIIARNAVRAEAVRRLRDKRAISKLRAEGFFNNLDDSKRQAWALEIEYVQSLNRKNSLAAEHEAEQLRLTQEREEAYSQLETALMLKKQLVFRAPESGYIESLLIHGGEFITKSMVLGKVVPSLLPSKVVAFIPERDRAFLRQGAKVRIELDQLPHAEFGTLQGEVLRISSNLASLEVLQDVLGNNAEFPSACFRVDIAIAPVSKEKPISKYLRTGMLAQVRFTLRSRRLISLVIQPLQNLLD